MKEVEFIISSNEKVGKDTYLLTLEGDTSAIVHPGEFVEVKLNSYFLRRPISVHDYKENELKLLYKVLGRGTKDLSSYLPSTKLNCLVNLGNGFDVTKSKKPLLIGGGIGIAPLYNLAKEFNKLNIKPIIILGFKNKEEVILYEEFKTLGEVIITSDDGSIGSMGNPVSYLKSHDLDYDYYYACGPLVMLKFLTQFSKKGQVSLEERMGCGFGACMGCSIQTKNGIKRVCKEGPVFDASEVEL